MLKRNLKQAATTVKAQAYKTIVRPQLEYASAICDPHTAKDMYSINKIQNYAQDGSIMTIHTTQTSLPYKILYPIYKYPSKLHATPQK